MNAAVVVRIVMAALLAGAALALGVGPLAAEDSSPAPTTQPTAAAQPVGRPGPLAGLPSAPGPHIAKVQAMGENQWLNLGSPAPDPKWGKGRGRSWSCKMPYAADLGGAFLNGQGVHGFVKPDGHYMDDIFFYDLNAHRWICLYPGMDTRNFVDNVRQGALTVNDDGQLVDREGQAVPFSAIMGHSYQDHTYDAHLRKYVFFGGPGVGTQQHIANRDWLKVGRGMLVDQGKPDRVAGAAYYYDVQAGRFERTPHLGVRAPGGFRGRVLFYLPSRKSLWAYGAGVTAMRDPRTGQWSDLKAQGPTPPGIDFAACYDSKRDRVYVGWGGFQAPLRGKQDGMIYIYDVKTNTWTSPPDKGRAPTLFGSNASLMHYDVAADRVVHVVHDRRERGIYVFNPESGAWGDALLPLAAEIGTRGQRRDAWSGFYSPEMNAHVFHTASDSQDNGAMWAYRYKRAEKP